MIVDSHREPAPRALATLALALLFGLAASEARAGIAFVKNLGTATGNNTGTSITITLAAGVSVAAGNSIIVSFVGPDLSGTYSATDSAGNSYSVNASGARAGTVRTVVLSAHNVNALASGNTITVTFPSTSNRRAVTADEFSGLAKTGTFDQSHTGNGSNTAPDSGFTATTAQAAELLLGAIGVAGSASDTFTAGNDGHGGTYTALTRVNSGGNIFYVNPEYEIVAATNTYKATATITSQNWAADVATYQADSNCGNGTIDAGEDCDQGASNGTVGSCCSASCRFVTSGTICRAAANACDVAESCTGSSATCPADAVKAAGTACTDDGNPCTSDVCDGTAGAPACTHPAGNAGAACRAAAGECDVAETCTGTSTTCPADAKQPAGTACTADTNPCTLDQCDGSTNTCTHPAGNAGTVCRAAAGECDLAESCTGTSTTCPTDAFKTNGNACTDDGNVCTRDICNGTSATCTHPAGNAGTVCRAAAGPCDAAETCTGTSTTCPANAFLPSSTVCRAAVDLCDAAENCTGTSATCPADAIKSAGSVCRAAAAECDLAETCDGVTTACPTDAKKSAGTACTADANPCTLDQCDGTNVTCQHPAGNAGAVCRAAAGECDVAETCTGTSTTCPADAKKSAGTACTADTNPCTLDQCDGTNVTCQHPAGNAGAVCRAAAGPCDVAETCTGTSTTCPTDAFLSASSVCRASSSLCNPAELCTGSSAACPADVNYGAVCWLQDLGANGNENAGTTISITPLAGSVAVGHGVIVSVAMDPDSGAVSCADSGGNTYNLDADQINGSGTTGVRTLIFSTRVTTALASGDAIILTFQNAIVAKAVSAAEFYGIVALDQTATAIGNSITPSSGLTAPTTSADELLFGAIGVETKLNQAFTAGTGYTQLVREQSDPNAGAPGRHVTIDPEFRTVTATGSYAADAILGAPRLWAAAIPTYTAGCGNGTVEGAEQCDDGPNNGTSGSCCNTDCTFEA